MVLFGCRMLLAHNNMLFPCHKTMTFELQKCKNLPESLFEKIDLLLNNPTLDNAESFYRLIKDYRQWEETPNGWPNQYMADSELMWLNGQCPVSVVAHDHQQGRPEDLTGNQDRHQPPGDDVAPGQAEQSGQDVQPV